MSLIYKLLKCTFFNLKGVVPATIVGMTALYFLGQIDSSPYRIEDIIRWSIISSVLISFFLSVFFILKGMKNGEIKDPNYLERTMYFNCDEFDSLSSKLETLGQRKETGAYVLKKIFIQGPDIDSSTGIASVPSLRITMQTEKKQLTTEPSYFLYGPLELLYVKDLVNFIIETNKDIIINNKSDKDDGSILIKIA